MTQEELVAVYDQYVGVSFTVPKLVLGCFFFMLFVIYFIAQDEVGRFKSKGWMYSTITILGVCVIVIVVFAVRVMFAGDEINEIDSDYEMVEEQFILPYFNSLEPIIYHELELTQKIGQTIGRASTTYRYNVIGGKIQGKPESQSKLAAEFDKTFTITDLVFEESKEDYSYIEYRQFPFELDKNYNEKFEQTRAFFTVEDMAALIDSNKDVWRITMKKDLAEKVETYQMAQQSNLNEETER